MVKNCRSCRTGRTCYSFRHAEWHSSVEIKKNRDDDDASVMTFSIWVKMGTQESTSAADTMEGGWTRLFPAAASPPDKQVCVRQIWRSARSPNIPTRRNFPQIPNRALHVFFLNRNSLNKQMCVLKNWIEDLFLTFLLHCAICTAWGTGNHFASWHGLKKIQGPWDERYCLPSS